MAGAVAALAEAALALASLNVEGSTLDAAAVRALAGLVETATGLESLSLTLPPLPAATADTAEAVEALLDAAAKSPSLRRLGLEGPRGYLTDRVVAAILRAERAFERNRARARAVAAAGHVGVGEGRGQGLEPTLSELVLSILFDGRVEDDGNEGEEEDVATTVAILRRRLRSLEVCLFCRMCFALV